MAATKSPKTTFTATIVIDGETLTFTKTSTRALTHAAIRKVGNPKLIAQGKIYFATWHGSAALAWKDTDFIPTLRVVEVTAA